MLLEVEFALEEITLLTFTHGRAIRLHHVEMRVAFVQCRQDRVVQVSSWP